MNLFTAGGGHEQGEEEGRERPAQIVFSGAAPDHLPGVEGVAAPEVPAAIHDRGADGPGRVRRQGRVEAAGFVYLIRGAGKHKIGRSKDPTARLEQIATGPHRLELLHQIATDDTAKLEAYFHRAFAHRRVRGEWFKLDAAELVAFMSVAAYHDEADLPATIRELHDAAIRAAETGEPRRNVGINLTPTEIARLDEIAHRLDISRSSLLVAFMRLYGDDIQPISRSSDILPPGHRGPRGKGRRKKPKE
jgi:hypothetical protein